MRRISALLLAAAAAPVTLSAAQTPVAEIVEREASAAPPWEDVLAGLEPLPDLEPVLAALAAEALPAAPDWISDGPHAERLRQLARAGDQAGALELARDQWQLAVDAGSAPALATARLDLARALTDLARTGQAETVLRAAAGDPDPDDVRRQAVRMELARRRTALGDYDGSERLVRAVLAKVLERDGGPGPQAARAAWRHADALRALGALDRAEPAAREALRLARALLGADPELAEALSTLARVHEIKGDVDAAQPLYVEALRVEREHGPEPGVGVARALNNLGVVERARGRPAEAEALLREAVAMQRRLRGDRDAGVAAILHNLAGLLDGQGRYDEALELEREALAIYRAVVGEDHPSLAVLLNGLASTLRRQGDDSAAREVFAEVLERLRSGHDESHPWVVPTLAQLAATSLALDDHEAAAAYAREALELGDAIRTRARGGPRERALFDAQLTQEALVATLIGSLVELGELEEAVAAAEHGYGRVLLDLLDHARVATPADPSREPGAGDGWELWPAARPASAAEVRAVLGPDDLMLLYVECDLVDAEPRVLLLVVPPPLEGPAGEVRAHVLADDYGPLGELRDALEATTAAQRRADADEGAAHELSEWLLPADVAARLGPRTRLVVVPSGPLQDLAFEALPIPGSAGEELLIDRVAEVVYAPSGTVYRRCRRASRAEQGAVSALVLGDPAFAAPEPRDAPAGGSAPRSELERLRLAGESLPPLPGTRHEVERIAERVEAAGGSVALLLGPEATRERLEAEVGGRRFVHLATHGLIGTPERPYDAGLALAPSAPGEGLGFLTLGRMLGGWGGRLEGCDLVVLSACDTQRAARIGPSHMALSWGFFYAGADTVVASLWKVDDAAAALLMARFYENLLGTFPAPRAVSGRSFEPGRPMPGGAALFEAKRWLRSASRRDVRELERRGTLGDAPRERGPTEGTSATASAELRPYAAPYFWAGFVLIGDPD